MLHCAYNCEGAPPPLTRGRGRLRLEGLFVTMGEGIWIGRNKVIL